MQSVLKISFLKMLSAVTLRPATTSDASLFYSVIAETMRSFIISTWGAWDEQRVLREAREDYTFLGARVVLFGGEEAAVLSVSEESAYLEVTQLYLLPPFQLKGIGAELMNAVLQKAREQKKRVRLKVLQVNPAKQFYEKLGFAIYAEDNDFYYMQKEALHE